MGRRRFLQVGTAVGLGAAVAGSPVAAALARNGPRARPRSASGQTYEPVARFPAGVLSGDPTPDGIVLWTRIDSAMARSAEVGWELGRSAGFEPGSILRSGTVITEAGSDHTAHVEVSGLEPGTTYWYRFTSDGVSSPVGRTRTLPVGSVASLRLAYFSCQRYVHGYYNAHADLAARALDPATDIDLVISLGDYVYEAGPADDVTVAGRVDPEVPTVTLEDYRRQYHLYRTDPDLQAMHAAFPIVAIFDNHDGFSGPSDAAGPGARAAFFEQMPVRRSTDDPNRQYRSFRLGGLGELFLLDERQYRDPTPEESGELLGTSSADQPLMVEPGRSMLGAGQRAWLLDGLVASSAIWKIVGSQLVFSPLRSERDAAAIAAAGDGPQRNAGRYVNLIGWDGYQAERREIVDTIWGERVSDVMVVAGDAHFWTASELSTDYDDPDAPRVLTEFGGSSITSANAGEQPDLPGNDLIRPVVAPANPLSLRFIDAVTHGYGLIELTPAGASVTYVAVPVAERGATSSTLARFQVDRGDPTIRMVEGEGFMPASDPDGGTGSGDDEGDDEGGDAGDDGTGQGSTSPAAATGAVPLAATATYTG